MNTADIIVEKAIVNGLSAAVKYQKNKPRLSPAQQEELLKTSFPSVPSGTGGIAQLTDEQCRQLRTCMHDADSKKMSRSIACLRGQLTEYHSLLDKLSSMTAKYEALEKVCQDRDDRIQSLEDELAALKESHGKSHCVRRRVTNDGLSAYFMHQAGKSTMEEHHQAQRYYEFLHDDSQHASMPSPSMNHPSRDVSREDGAHYTSSYFSSKLGQLSSAGRKRNISNESSDVITHYCQLQGSKRFKSS